MNKQTYLVVISNSYKDKEKHNLMEFLSLCITAGYELFFTSSQSVEEPNPSTFLGTGFLNGVKEYIDVLLDNHPEFDGEIVVATNFDLTGTQRANLKKFFNYEVIDRTYVILKIFENNAHTKEAKLQVDIATLTWSKNHLINKEGAYSQVTSGGGMHNKGSGEKKIALDKRHINLLIESKKRELEKIKLARKNSRSRRNNSGIYKIAVVGYTNAGKSTLINTLIDYSHGQKTLLAKDQLFATLETSTREFSKYGYLQFLITDTVGFISNLPTTLVDAFRSTLEEILEADLLVHVVDYSYPLFKEQIAITNQILEEIGVKDIPCVYLYNKYDKVGKALPRLLKDNEMYCSLADDKDIDEIYHFIASSLSRRWEKLDILFPYEADFAAFSKDNYIVSSRKNKNGYQCTVYINPRTRHKYDYLLDKNC